MFVAIPTGAPTDTYITSEDGVTWDVRTLPVSKSWLDMVYTGAMFYVVGSDFTALRSINGIDWSTETLSVDLSISDRVQVAWSGSKFCISYGFNPIEVTTSTDGTVWSAPAYTDFAGGPPMAANTELFCTFGWSTGSTAAQTSTDGTTWVEHDELPPSDVEYTRIVWGDDRFCAVPTITPASGTDIIAITSPTGATWTAHALPLGSGFCNLVWAGSFFCAIPAIDPQDEVAYNINEDIAMTSPDGAVWTPHILPRIEKWSGAAWDGNVICVVGDNFHALTSPDGATWTEQILPLDRSTWIMAASSGVVPSFWKNFRRSIEI